MTFIRILIRMAGTLGAVASLQLGCAGFPDDGPSTGVVLENGYKAGTAAALTVYDAQWLNVSFQGSPVAPGATSAPQPAVPSSANAAYALLAPGWGPTSTVSPVTLIVMQSRSGFGVGLGETLHILVDDTNFQGNCAAGSHLSQAEADFLARIVFAKDFSGLRYDASTCATTQEADAGGQ